MKEIFTITIELDLYHTEFFICRMSEKEVKNTNQHFESKIQCGTYTDVRENDKFGSRFCASCRKKFSMYVLHFFQKLEVYAFDEMLQQNVSKFTYHMFAYLYF